VLFPIFSKILLEAGSDVFSPFVFQLFSYFLETRKSLPEGYRPLFKELVTPLYWEQSGNIPALTRLVEAFLQTGPDCIVSGNLLVPVLGVFQKLVASKVNDQFGFRIIRSIAEHVPLDNYDFALLDILKIIFTRIQGSKTTQLIRGFIVFFSYFIVKNGPIVFIEKLRALQANLLIMVLQNLWLPYVDSVKHKIERKICAIAMIKLLTEWSEARTSEIQDLRSQLVKQVSNLVVGIPTAVTEKHETEEITYDEQDYTSGYTLLSHTAKVEIDPCKDVDVHFLLRSL